MGEKLKMGGVPCHTLANNLDRPGSATRSANDEERQREALATWQQARRRTELLLS